MILVTLGTQDNSFERLLKEIEHLIEKGIIKDEVVVQAGNTKYKSNKMKIIDFVPQKELVEYINKSSYIITHGGVGSITEALRQNKKVIAIPRKKEYKEHVNNHQIQIVENFNMQGFIIGIKDVEELENAINKIPNFKPNKYKTNTQNIIKIIEDSIKSEKLARIDYVEIVDSSSLEKVEEINKSVLVAIAVFIGKTRLIDNFTYEL